LIESFEAQYKNGRVSILNCSELIELLDRGFGTRREKRLDLSPYEAFFLTEKGRISVIDAKSREHLSLHDLITRYSQGRRETWIRYLVYRDLRDRGYIVRESRKVDFEIYGKGAERRLVHIVYEGGEASLRELTTLIRYAAKQRKELILAVIDRRTDLVYYSVGEMDFYRRSPGSAGACEAVG
jgi:tRNA-intron endonuclease